MNFISKRTLFGFPLGFFGWGEAFAADPTGSNTATGPSGAAGGDLSGTFPNPTVAKVLGSALATVAFSGNAGDLSTGILSGARMVALTGDLTGANGTTAVTVSAIGGVAPGPMATAAAGQIPGSTNSDNASSGNVGQYVSVALSSASAIALSSGNATTIASAVLTPGDWNVWGTVVFVPATITVVTIQAAAVSLVSAALPLLNVGGVIQSGLGAGLTGGGPSAISIPAVRMSISSAASQTAYLLASLAFATNTATAYGVLQARRVR